MCFVYNVNIMMIEEKVKSREFIEIASDYLQNLQSEFYNITDTNNILRKIRPVYDSVTLKKPDSVSLLEATIHILNGKFENNNYKSLFFESCKCLFDTYKYGILSSFRNSPENVQRETFRAVENAFNSYVEEKNFKKNGHMLVFN